MNKKLIRSIRLLVEYSFPGEKRHWEESDKPKNHIYSEIRRIRKWLNSNKQNTYE